MTWNPFKKTTDEQPAEQDEPAASKESGAKITEGKGRPTPKRKEAQAKNLRPLVPKDRQASAKAAKQRIRAREDAEYEAMQNGDVRHMPKSEQLPWRVYIRDYVDARYNLGEFFIPVIVVMMVVMMVFSSRSPQAVIVLTILMYAYLFAVIIDIVVMWRKLKKKLVAKFGDRAVARGSRSCMYAWSRSIQIRRWRLPKPTSPKRGNWPD